MAFSHRQGSLLSGSDDADGPAHVEDDRASRHEPGDRAAARKLLDEGAADRPDPVEVAACGESCHASSGERLDVNDDVEAD